MTKVFTIFFTILLLSNLCFGQEFTHDENWLKGFRTEADRFPTLEYWENRKFTLEDVANGKRRLNLIRQFTAQNEWEEIYYGETGIGDNKFIWNSEGGFFSFYFYHTLKNFHFGKVKDSSDFIELDYEKTPFSQTDEKSVFKDKLIKVRVNESRFLVPEIRIQDFCELAAGLSTNSDIYFYWIKEEDMHKTRLGLPVLPAKYEKHLRHPVEVRITYIRSKQIVPSEFDPLSKEIQYAVKINAGKNKNLKKDMDFFVDELGEWVRLTNVFQTNSVGYIRRNLDENNQEQCWDSEGGSGQTIPCKKIKVGMKAKTKGNL